MIETRLQYLHRADPAQIPHSSIMHSYIHNSLPPTEKTPQHLHDTTNMILAAGFETTGFALTTATYHILSQPSVLARLQHELRAIPHSSSHSLSSSASTQLSWPTLSKLPYLSAIIKESLRLSLGASARLPRVNKHEEMRYGSWVIPKGTAASMSHARMHYDEEVFPEPKAFRPERWLKGEEEVKRLERYLVSFSRGGRRCMGIQYAAFLLMVFDFNWRLLESH